MPSKILKKILIAEDDQPLAKALKLKLELSGFEATICNDGEQALNALTKNKYSLALLDLMMPKKDGFSVLADIKEKKIKIPVIIISNLGQEGDIKKAKDLGAVGYLVKSNTPIAEIVNYVKKELSA